MNYKELESLGFDKEWVDVVKDNWKGKTEGKYTMDIYAIDTIDDEPYTGKLITTTFFDTPEDLDEIHKYFEGFGYVMTKQLSSTPVFIGQGIIDYSPYEEMEAYTGEPWPINVDVEKNNQSYAIPDERKLELYSSLIGYLYETIDDKKEFISVLRDIGFTYNELKAEGLLPEEKVSPLNTLIENAEKRVSPDKGKESVILEYDK